MVTSRFSSSEGPKLSNRLGDTGRVSFAWPTATQLSDDSNERTNKGAMTSLISWVGAILPSNMMANVNTKDVNYGPAVIEL